MKKSDIRAWLKSWDAGEFDFTAALPQNYSDPNANAGNTDHPWKLEPVDRLEQGEIRSFRKIYPVFAVVLCCIMISFLLLTVVILSGAIWAEQAWSAFWTWDPKETWALITWILYAIYLHLRLRKKLSSKVMAWIVVIAVPVVLFTFVGVNTLLPGLHSYG